ncbi:MAG: hypothetical protein U0269_27920 [Polyangiales bacterium]
MNRVRKAAFAAGLLSLCACATTGTTSNGSGGQREARFGAVPLPARRQVRTLRERAPSLRAGQEVGPTVAEWRLTGPLPAAIDRAHEPLAWSTTDPLEQVAQRAAPPTVRTSEALRCFARELAQYSVRNPGVAPPTVNHYLAAACGLSQPGRVHVSSIRAASESASTEAILAQLGNQLADQLRPLLAGAADGAGVAIARDRLELHVAIVAREEVAAFDTVTMGASNECVVRGQVRGASEQDAILVMANTRDGGVRVCAPEQGILAPRFGVRCPASADGAPEFVEVMHVPRGRLLGRSVGTMLVGGSAEGRLLWSTAAHAPITFTDATATRAAMEAVVNGQRRSLGLAPLVFNAEENAAICPLGAYSIAAISGAGNNDEAEVAMLAMMAGWGVDGRIRGAAVGANALTTRDASTLLASTLTLPSGRVSLLDPQAARAVLCPQVVDAKFIGLSYATWQLVDEQRSHDVDAVWNRLDEERRRRGLAPVQRWTGAPRALSEAIAAIDSGRISPDDILQTLSQSAVNESATSVRAMAFAVLAPAGAPMQLPDELLATSLSTAQIATTWYRAPRAPWAVRLVLVLVPSGVTSTATV